MASPDIIKTCVTRIYAEKENKFKIFSFEYVRSKKAVIK
jgi:hypothetical protein